MISPFETCRQRIDRAALHGKTLAEIWNGFDTSSTYTTRAEYQDDGAGEIFIEPVDSNWLTSFSLQFGEMLYQFRAALDSCVYDAAVLHSGPNHATDYQELMFPICVTAKDFKKSSGRIKPLPEE